MKPVFSTIRHNPSNGEWGDCFRACIASVLELSTLDVPHFVDGPDEDIEGEWIPNARRWLLERGLSYLSFMFRDDPRPFMDYIAPNTFYLLGGATKSGIGHSVVCLNNEMVHDPTPPNGIHGPDADGWYWVALLSPIRYRTTDLCFYSAGAE